MADSKALKLKENQKSSYKLVDGVFEPNDAATVLFNLISDKIKFHNTLVLTTYEHTGEVNEKSQKRVDELVVSKNEINELVKQAQKEGFQMKVSSEITIELLKK